MAVRRVVVVGAGIGGLAATLDLAGRDVDVTVVESAGRPGGKMREILIDGRAIDSGPTVFTMRWVFDELLAAAGTSLDDEVTLRPLDILARHAWDAGARLDLYGDRARSADAIGRFAGLADARGFIAFCARARAIYNTLEKPFLRAPRGGPLDLVLRTGISGLPALWRIAPFATLMGALGGHFRDPRLRQLFGRYATYCGSSPYLSPATLMLIAHVEQEGVWTIAGGMARLADALARVAVARGVSFHFGTPAVEVLVERGRVCGVELGNGERLYADAVVVNADVAAIANGLLGRQSARAVPRMSRAAPSLSALTWTMSAQTAGFPLARHNVFFGGDYHAEFDDIFRQRRLPRGPTVYVCAQDRDGGDGPPITASERLLCLVNAPATGDSDRNGLNPEEIARCEEQTFSRLTRCGLEVRRIPGNTVTTTPSDFARLFPGTGGALYGRATHGWRASFLRPGSRTRIPGLYLAGGSVHPGPGVPMVALSGRLAAASVLEDLTSTRSFRATATPGGTSMRSPKTDATG